MVCLLLIMNSQRSIYWEMHREAANVDGSDSCFGVFLRIRISVSFVRYLAGPAWGGTFLRGHPTSTSPLLTRTSSSGMAPGSGVTANCFWREQFQANQAPRWAGGWDIRQQCSAAAMLVKYAEASKAHSKTSPSKLCFQSYL